MALVFFSGFETGDFGEWSSVTGSPTVVEADGWGAPKTGTYCMHIDTTGAAATAYVTKDVGGPGQPMNLSFYLYITVAPNTECLICGESSSQGGDIRLTTDRYIKVYNTDVEIMVSSSQLALNTWYRVSIGLLTPNHALYINSVSEDTVSDACAGYGDGNGEIELGVATSCTTTLYFDNFACGDLDSTDDIGDIRVLRSSPNAAGEYNTFDTISGYEECDEVPSDDATTIVDDSGVSVRHAECYNLESWGDIGGGASDTIKAVNVLTRIYTVNAGGGIIVRDDGTDYTTAKDVGKAYTWANVLYDVNAPRASAWTPAIFDAFQSGAYNEGKTDLYMSTVMDMVAFIPVGVTDYPISLSPGLTVSSTVAYKAAWDRTISPGLTAATTIAYLVAYKRATTPGLTVAVTVAKALGRLITTTADLTVSATVAKLVAYKRALTPGLTIAITILKGWGRKITTTAAGLTVSATVAVKKGFKKSLSPGLTVSATVAKSFGKKITVTSNLTISATVAYLVAYKRAVQAGLTTAVTILKGWGRKITTTPGLTISATVVRKLAYKRATSPGLTASATVVKGWGRKITTTANLTVSTTVAYLIAYKRAVTKNLTVSVTVVKGWGRKIVTSPSLTVSATISRAVAYKRAVTANLVVSVTISAVHTVVTRLGTPLVHLARTLKLIGRIRKL